MVGILGAALVVLADLGRDTVSEALHVDADIVLFAVALTGSTGFQPLRLWLERASDRFFFINSYDSGRLLEQLGRSVSAHA